MILILTDKKKYLNIKYFFIYTIKLIKNYFFIFYKLFFVRINWGLGIGDWGLGIGGLGVRAGPQPPTPQSPIPNPQSPIPNI